MNGPFLIGGMDRPRLFSQLERMVSRAALRAVKGSSPRLYTIRVVVDHVGNFAFDMRGAPSWVKTPPSVANYNGLIWEEVGFPAIQVAMTLLQNGWLFRSKLPGVLQNTELRILVDRCCKMTSSVRYFVNNHTESFVERKLKHEQKSVS